MAIVVETTRKVRAERRLQRRAGGGCSQMFEQAPGLIAMLEGPDHVFTLANRAMRALHRPRDRSAGRCARRLPETAAQGFVDHRSTTCGGPAARSSVTACR